MCLKKDLDYLMKKVDKATDASLKQTFYYICPYFILLTVQLLKSQKDKQRTFELLNRFLEENPHYTVEKENSREEVEEKKVSDEDFMEVYHNILRQLKHSRRTLKTSLSFEIIDTTHSLRKISVNLVSDLPSGKIYQLIKMFNGNRAISDQETEVYIADSDSSEASSSIYNKVYSKLPPGNRRGYTHTHGRDLYTPNKPVHSSQYASLQDLILQGRRS